jgi:hypothetical protein
VFSLRNPIRHLKKKSMTNLKMLMLSARLLNSSRKNGILNSGLILKNQKNMVKPKIQVSLKIY